MGIKDIVEKLRCPDCGSKLRFNIKRVDCVHCQKHFPYNDNYIDLMPSRPLQLRHVYSNRAFEKYYLRAFLTKGWVGYKNPTAWGRLEESSRGYRVFVREEEKFIRSLYMKKSGAKIEYFCDLSGGAGYYTFQASRHCKCVFHCDINQEFLEYCHGKARKKKINNIIFVRADYFSLPFENNLLDVVVSNDSLIYYGWKNDRKVIEGVVKKLTTNGHFIFDLHHKKWYAPDRKIYEYSKMGAEKLTKGLKSTKTRIYPFGRLPTLTIRNQSFFEISNLFFWMPAIRYVCDLVKLG